MPHKNRPEIPVGMEKVYRRLERRDALAYLADTIRYYRLVRPALVAATIAYPL